ncbi:MAG TPA: hypothetical protein VM077_06280 [Candidatus Limnocylindrales bacterium]|nr:hypothetical protein [Candidatus Limnocylindrales bacterium]
MITIIHGTDSAASRKYFLDLKQKSKDSVLINGQTVTITDLVQAFEGGGLFSESKSFFIEQLLSKKKKSRDLTQLIDYVINNSFENNIYLWEEGELTKPTLNNFKNPIIKLFKLPQTLFQFLENIKPGKSRELISLFHQTIESADAEMVFFMIVRQVRLLLGLSEIVSNPIDEIKRMAPWQHQKVQSQADAFEIQDLKILYSKLFAIEKGMKTGTLTSPLITTIDLLLLDI